MQISRFLAARQQGDAAVTGRVRRAGRIDLLPYALVSPTVILVLLITIFPLVYAIRLSFTNANLMELAEMKDVGLRNYTRAFEDPLFVGSIWRTLRYAFVVAVGQMLMALPLALFLNQPFRGRAIVRASILLPWVVPGAVIAIIWRFLVDANYGIVNDLLMRLGLISAPMAWFGEQRWAFWLIVSASYWASTPFVALTLLAALQSIPPELYEAAKVDGASALVRFRFVTFPMLLPTILLLFLLRTISLAHGVEFIFLMTMGGPGYSNYTLAVYTYLLLGRLEIGYPAAIAVMLGIVLIVMSAIYVRLMERSKEWM